MSNPAATSPCITHWNTRVPRESDGIPWATALNPDLISRCPDTTNSDDAAKGIHQRRNRGGGHSGYGGFDPHRSRDHIRFGWIGTHTGIGQLDQSVRQTWAGLHYTNTTQKARPGCGWKKAAVATRWCAAVRLRGSPVLRIRAHGLLCGRRVLAAEHPHTCIR